jgi:hypothetical protein
MRRRAARANAAPLPVSVVDYLLTGTCLTVDESRAAGIDDEYDACALYLDYGMPGDLERAWQQNRAWLVGEWRRRGGSGEPWIVRVREAR